MSSVVRQLSLWSGVALIAAFDAVLWLQMVAFIGYFNNAGSRSAGIWIVCISLASVPVLIWALRSYLAARRELSPRVLFVARLPLICFVGLVLWWFVVMPFILHFYA